MESAVPGVEDDLRAELAGKLAGFEVNADRPSAALAHAEQAARLSGDALAVSFTAPAAAASLSHLGRCAESLFLIDEALPVAIERGRSSMEVPQLLFTRVGTLGRDGRLDEALELASTCHEVALSIESLDGTALFGIAAGETLLRQGRPASAARLFREAVGLLEERDVFGYLRWAFAGLARSAAMLGDSDGAAMALEGARRSALGTRYFDAWLFDAEAAVHSLAGREPRGPSNGRAGCQVGPAGRAPGRGGHAAPHGDPGPGRHGRAHRRAGRRPAPRTFGGDRQHARLRTRSARGRARELGRVESSSPWPTHSPTARRGCMLPRPPPRRQRSTGAATSAGRPAPPSGERTRISPSAKAPSPPSSNGSVLPPALPSASFQVATLAAAGHSSNEIAARLDVSARTVDSHLYRTYAKLGITGRPGLAEALGRPSHSRPRPDPG